jgi:hypothetical protein
MAAQAPSSSAWTGSATIINGSNTTTANTQLLDTFEAAVSKPTADGQVQAVHSTAIPKGSGLLEAYGSLTEEQQKEIFAESDSEWNVVKSNKSKEKRKVANKTEQMENNNPKDERRSSSGERSDSATAPVSAPTRSSKTSKFATSHYDNDRNIVKGTVAVEDAEWDVS